MCTGYVQHHAQLLFRSHASCHVSLHSVCMLTVHKSVISGLHDFLQDAFQEVAQQEGIER